MHSFYYICDAVFNYKYWADTYVTVKWYRIANTLYYTEKRIRQSLIFPYTWRISTAYIVNIYEMQHLPTNY